MSRRTTLKHAVIAALATGAILASSAAARPLDRIDRFGPEPAPTPAPHQDLRGEHSTDPAPPGSEKFMPGQPTWPAYPVPLAKPVAPAQPVAASSDSSDTSDDTVWLILGIGLAAGGIVAGSAAGVRHHVRARRVAV